MKQSGKWSADHLRAANDDYEVHRVAIFLREVRFGAVKCSSCQGALSLDQFLLCPYCGVRQEVDLRNVHFRHLGAAEGMGCPRCDERPMLERVGLDLDGRETEVERCGDCQGLFFNPGELEAFLQTQVATTLWTDFPRMDQIREEIQKLPRPEEGGKFYIPCPHPGCGVSMNRKNFGRGSGLMVDSCRDHGVWLDGGELRALAGWWHAGGKFVHQAAELKAAEARLAPPPSSGGGGGGGLPESFGTPWGQRAEGAADAVDVFVVLGHLAAGVIAFFKE